MGEVEAPRLPGDLLLVQLRRGERPDAADAVALGVAGLGVTGEVVQRVTVVGDLLCCRPRG